MNDSALVVSHSRMRSYENLDKLDSCWSAPQGFGSFSTIPSYLMNFLSKLWNEPLLLSSFRTGPTSSLPPVLKNKFHSIDKAVLRSFEEIELGLSVREESLFGNKAFREGDVLGTYYGRLFYRNISINDSTEDNMRQRYGVGIFSTSVDAFNRSAVSSKISGAFKDFSRTNLVFGKTSMEVFVVPASFFCVFPYARHFSWDGVETKASGDRFKSPSNFRKHLNTREAQFCA